MQCYRPTSSVVDVSPLATHSQVGSVLRNSPAGLVRPRSDKGGYLLVPSREWAPGPLLSNV